MSQIESAEQVNVSNSAGAFEQVSQQVWSSMEDGGNSLSNKFSESHSRDGMNSDSSDSILPSVSFTGDEADLLQKEDTGFEGELKEEPKEQGIDEKPLPGDKPELPRKPINKYPLDKPSKPMPDKPDPMEKPKPIKVPEPVGKFEI